VIADDDELAWTKQVLANVQQFSISNGFFVQKMQAQLHQYHLDDAPDLRSCNIVLKGLEGNRPPGPSERITDSDRLRNFYGRDASPRVHFVRERKRLDYGKAREDEYMFEFLEVEGSGGSDH